MQLEGQKLFDFFSPNCKNTMEKELMDALVELAANQNTMLKTLASLLERVEKLQESIDFLSGKPNL